jgi:hypothetical protein
MQLRDKTTNTRVSSRNGGVKKQSGALSDRLSCVGRTVAGALTIQAIFNAVAIGMAHHSHTNTVLILSWLFGFLDCVALICVLNLFYPSVYALSLVSCCTPCFEDSKSLLAESSKPEDPSKTELDSISSLPNCPSVPARSRSSKQVLE